MEKQQRGGKRSACNLYLFPITIDVPLLLGCLWFHIQPLLNNWGCVVQMHDSWAAVGISLVLLQHFPVSSYPDKKVQWHKQRTDLASHLDKQPSLDFQHASYYFQSRSLCGSPSVSFFKYNCSSALNTRTQTDSAVRFPPGPLP